MKKTLRFASAALALAIAASAALPAFAAVEDSFRKEETVYAVMNADGRIRSCTISEHLHRDGGLRGTTDCSTLKNIQNTQTEVTFTQEGENLCWETDDTDVYYTGDTDRALPVSAQITYTLDGQTAPLGAAAGQERTPGHHRSAGKPRDRHRYGGWPATHHRHPAGGSGGHYPGRGCYRPAGRAWPAGDCCKHSVVLSSRRRASKQPWMAVAC